MCLCGRRKEDPPLRLQGQPAHRPCSCASLNSPYQRACPRRTAPPWRSFQWGCLWQEAPSYNQLQDLHILRSYPPPRRSLHQTFSSIPYRSLSAFELIVRLVYVLDVLNPVAYHLGDSKLLLRHTKEAVGTHDGVLVVGDYDELALVIELLKHP